MSASEPSIPVAFLGPTVAELMWGGTALTLTLSRRRIGGVTIENPFA